MHVFLLQAELIEKASQATPWNALGYGLLVAVLIAAVVGLWRAYMAEKNFNRNLAEKALTLISSVSEALHRNESINQSVQNIIAVLESEKGLKTEIKRELERISDLIKQRQ